MDTRAIAQQQLTLTYEAYNKSYEQRLNDKKLCITVWLALLGFVASRTSAAGDALPALTFAPIVLFWLLDGMRAVYTQVWHSRIARLEHLLLTEEISADEIRPLMFVSGADLTDIGKISALAYSLFRMESVFVFYLFLAAVNALFYFLYFHAQQL